jgi:hypothetical protein
MTAMEGASLLFAVAPRIFDLFKELGSRDAVFAALDSLLVTARAKNDDDLNRKHGG